MDKDHRLTIEEFKEMLDNAIDNDSRFVRVYILRDGCYSDIVSIRLFGNTIIIQTK